MPKLNFPEEANLEYIENADNWQIVKKVGDKKVTVASAKSRDAILVSAEYLQDVNRLIVVTLYWHEEYCLSVYDLQSLKEIEPAEGYPPLKSEKSLAPGLYAIHSDGKNMILIDTYNARVYDIAKLLEVGQGGTNSIYPTSITIINTSSPTEYTILSITYANGERVHIPLSLNPKTPFASFGYFYSEARSAAIRSSATPGLIDLASFLLDDYSDSPFMDELVAEIILKEQQDMDNFIATIGKVEEIVKVMSPSLVPKLTAADNQN